MNFCQLSLDGMEINKVKAGRRKEVLARLKIWKIREKKTYRVDCKVDTGAEGNILPIEYYRRLFPENIDGSGNLKPGSLKKSDITLSAYGGSQLKNLGTANLHCSYKGQKFMCKLYMTDIHGPVILELNTCTALNIVQINSAVEESETIKKMRRMGQKMMQNMSHHIQRH